MSGWCDDNIEASRRLNLIIILVVTDTGSCHILIVTWCQTRVASWHVSTWLSQNFLGNSRTAWILWFMSSIVSNEFAKKLHWSWPCTWHCLMSHFYWLGNSISLSWATLTGPTQCCCVMCHRNGHILVWQCVYRTIMVTCDCLNIGLAGSCCLTTRQDVCCLDKSNI